jgi:IS5 family transposase
VLENLNAVSEETQSFIVDCQLAHVLDIGLDDFLKQTIDSTSVDANSAWPTELHLIEGFLNDAYRLGQRLDRFGLPNCHQWHICNWLQELSNFEFAVNLSSRRDRRAFKSSYLKFVKKAFKITDYLAGEYDRLDDLVTGVPLKPSRRACLTRLWDHLQSDLLESYILLDYTGERVLGSGKTNREKYEEIYSLSDRSARFIKKGGRKTVFGYKIQLGRSENGFISSVLVPEDNAADSGQLVPMVLDHYSRTGVVPDLVSTDDGYSSAKGRNDVLGLGVKDISISGSKGKKITPRDDWESSVYTQARSDRSAVESLMFTGKHCFEFGQFHRRGIDGVRCEMLEKVIAYNFWRISYERARQAEAATASRRRAA